jgi:hypothetical protein
MLGYMMRASRVIELIQASSASAVMKEKLRAVVDRIKLKDRDEVDAFVLGMEAAAVDDDSADFRAAMKQVRDLDCAPIVRTPQGPVQ